MFFSFDKPDFIPYLSVEIKFLDIVFPKPVPVILFYDGVSNIL